MLAICSTVSDGWDMAKARAAVADVMALAAILRRQGRARSPGPQLGLLIADAAVRGADGDRRHRARASPSTVSGIEVPVPRVNQPTSGGFVRAARTTWAVPSASTVTSWMWMSSVLVVS